MFWKFVSIYLREISEIIHFWWKFSFLVKMFMVCHNFHFWSTFPFLVKILIFDENFHFWWQFSFLVKKFYCWSKFSFLVNICILWSKFLIFVKNFILDTIFIFSKRFHFYIFNLKFSKYSFLVKTVSLIKGWSWIYWYFYFPPVQPNRRELCSGKFAEFVFAIGASI